MVITAPNKTVITADYTDLYLTAPELMKANPKIVNKALNDVINTHVESIFAGAGVLELAALITSSTPDK